MEELFIENRAYCPICGKHFFVSAYLKTVFDNPKQLWLANMVTHYRHDHITSWNKCWEHGGHHYRGGWFGDYDDEKEKVNERAKRQILRKAKDFLHFHSFGIDDFSALQNTSPATITLAEKLL